MKKRPGKRERAARKRETKARTVVTYKDPESGWQTLKLGHRKYGEWVRKQRLPF